MAEFKEFWPDLKDKLPVKAQKWLGDFMFEETPNTCGMGCPPACVGMLAKIPVVDLAVDLLDTGKAPSLEALKDGLNAMGLLSALALTVVMALPSAVTYDELTSYINEDNVPDEDEDMKQESGN